MLAKFAGTLDVQAFHAADISCYTVGYNASDIDFHNVITIFSVNYWKEA